MYALKASCLYALASPVPIDNQPDMSAGNPIYHGSLGCGAYFSGCAHDIPYLRPVRALLIGRTLGGQGSMMNDDIQVSHLPIALPMVNVARTRR